jgi:potassium/hydrogen antiporter
MTLEQGLIIVAGLLLLSILASKVSTKLGIPALVLFVGIGMLAGSEGLGGIAFDNYHLARDLGTIALALILFSGGLDTPWAEIKPLIGRGISLATLGIVATAALVGLFAWQLLGFEPLPALLLGAIVSSTDAAAVFAVLRARRVRLRKRLAPLLELESGSNDPMAVFFTYGLTTLILNPSTSLMSFGVGFVQQMVVGGAVGWGLGIAASWIMNHLRLEYDGLYPVVSLSIVLLAFGGTQFIGGNGFLAVYVAGVTLGTQNFLHKIGLVQFHEGVAWLMQIAMFLVLGLLVFPGRLLEVAGAGLLLSAFLILVARPLAVFISLLGSRKMRNREKLFVSWAGLRGALPIILATIPLTAGVPGSDRMFNLVFFVVLSSVLVQGTTLGLAARLLSVIAPAPVALPERNVQENLMEIVLEPGARVIGKQVVDLRLPPTALLVLLRRSGESYIPRGATVLQEGDTLLVATRKEDWDELRSMLTG